MWIYEKKLQYPVNIKTPCPRLAKIVMEQYGGRYATWYNYSAVITYTLFPRAFEVY